MTRSVTLDAGRFLVTDDPRHIIGRVLGMLVSNLSCAELDATIRRDSDDSGHAVDTVGGVCRIDRREDLPEPWDQDPTLDPESTELWALKRDDVAIWVVLTGDELRDLVARAHALQLDAARAKLQ